MMGPVTGDLAVRIGTVGFFALVCMSVLSYATVQSRRTSEEMIAENQAKSGLQRFLFGVDVVPPAQAEGY